MRIKSKKEKIVSRIEIENDYIVEMYNEDINVENGKNYIEFWLFKKNFGVKSFMFGIVDQNQSEEELLLLIRNNIEEYILIYEEENEGEE